jgi:hypothetical protein
MHFVENRELKECCDNTHRLRNGVFARYDGGANEHYRRRGEYGRSSRTAYRIDHRRFVPSSRIVHANHIKGGPTSPNRRSRAWGRAHAPRDASDDLIGHFAAVSTIAGRFAKDPGRQRRPSATASLTPACPAEKLPPGWDRNFGGAGGRMWLDTDKGTRIG